MGLSSSNNSDFRAFPFLRYFAETVLLARLAWSKLSNNIEDSQQLFEKKTFVGIKN